MSNEKIQEYLRNIGIVLAIAGGVLAAMQSVESTYAALSSFAFWATAGLSAVDGIPAALSAIVGLVAGGLSIALTWSAFLAIQSPGKRHGKKIVICASIPIALGVVVLIVIGLVLGIGSSTSVEYTLNTMNLRTATNGMGNIFEYLSLAVIGGVLILLSASKKLEPVGESQQTEGPD